MLIIVKRKYNLYKRYKSSGLDRDYGAYAKQRNETNAKIRQAQKNYEEKLINIISRRNLRNSTDI